MGKRLMVLAVCALVVGMALPAFAAVNNIKVSGDIDMYGIHRNNIGVGAFAPATKYGQKNINEDFFLTITRLRVDADLTDNVSTTVRLINERVWENDNSSAISGGTGSSVATTDIDLDLAYATMKEFLYSPLTLTVGRQELHFGNDMIVGAIYTNQGSNGTLLTSNAGIIAEDLSKRKAFDAIRATLDYNPLTVDMFYAKISDNIILAAPAATTDTNDDTNLYGINAKYSFGGKYNTVGEAYWFGKFNRGNSTIGTSNKTNTTQTFGLRGQLQPIARLMNSLEVAMQNGNVYLGSGLSNQRQAWALQSINRYALNAKWSPVFMANYSYFSGDKNSSDKHNSNWDPMYENQTSGRIINFLFSQTNCQNIKLSGSIVPLEDVTLTLDFVMQYLAKKVATGVGAASVLTANGSGTALTAYSYDGSNRHLGNELDFTVAYDYTEDVQLKLMLDTFYPGDVFLKGNPSFTGTIDGRRPISQAIAEVSVSF